jgi:hypothetical protein
LIGSILAARIKDLSGSFAGMMPIIALVLLVSLILPFITRKPGFRTLNVNCALSPPSRK